MSAQRKFLSLKNQLITSLGFIILFLGLLFHFLIEDYPMLGTFNYLYIIADCVGSIIILLSLFFAFSSNKTNLDESWRPLVIESFLTFTFHLSLQATIFHYLFHNSLTPAGLGVLFIFISYIIFIPIFMSMNLSLFKKYYLMIFSAITFVTICSLISGVFLTFTGSIDPITTEGIGLLSVGIMSIVSLIIVLITYPKWKSLLLDEKEVDEEEEED